MMVTSRELERQLDQAKRRAVRHWYEDGISEMAVGGYFLILGLLIFLADRSDLVGRVAQVLWPLYILVGAFLIARLVRRGKEQVTYPRSGYIRFPGTGRARWMVFGLTALLAALVVGALIWAGQPLSAWGFLGLQSLIFLAVFGYLALQTGLIRLYVVALVGAMLPWAVAWSGVDPRLWDPGVYTGVGLLLFLSGLWAFVHFRRRPPILDTQEVDRG